MTTVYRGTQHAAISGIRKGASFAYSLAVAAIWSARPGDPWASSKERRETRFLETSTIHAAHVNAKNPLRLADDNHMSLGDILRALRYPGNISDDEVRKIYNYLHNRIIGKAAGGEFAYYVLTPDGDERDDDEVPLDFSCPQSLVTLARDDWDCDPGLDTADLLVADTYIFADAPAVQRAAQRLGYDVLVYPDVFQGGIYAAEELLGRSVGQLSGVTWGHDLRHKTVPVHDTLRVLDPAAVSTVSTRPTAELLQAGDVT